MYAFFNTFDISEPWAPAFIYTAPPTEPGIPLANSNPESPFLLNCTERLTSEKPAPAVILVPSISNESNPLPNLITAPFMP